MKLAGMRTRIPAVFSLLFSLKVKEKYNQKVLLSFQAITFDTSDTSVTNYYCTGHC